MRQARETREREFALGVAAPSGEQAGIKSIYKRLARAADKYLNVVTKEREKFFSIGFGTSQQPGRGTSVPSMRP